MSYEDELLKKFTFHEEAAPPQQAQAQASSDVAISLNIGKGTLLLFRDIGIAFIAIVIALQFMKPMVVFEHSMEDTLFPNDYIIVSMHHYDFTDIKFEDVAVFESELLDDRGKPKNLIKRIIGLPGDTIEVKDDTVYRNGEVLDDSYTKEHITRGQMDPVTVPPNQYFVLGDNRQVSKDSRSATVGFVSKNRMIGKVVFRLLPISTARIVS